MLLNSSLAILSLLMSAGSCSPHAQRHSHPVRIRDTDDSDLSCVIDDACTLSEGVCQCDYTDDSWMDGIDWDTLTNNITSSAVSSGSSTTLSSETTASLSNSSAMITSASSGGDIASLTSSTSATATITSDPYCTPYQDPHAGSSLCSCTDGAQYSLVTGNCPYTAGETSGLMISTSTSEAPAPTGTLSTQTDPFGNEVACTSFSAIGGGIPGSVCVGPTIYTAPTTTTETPTSTASTATATPSESCHTAYKAFYDSFTIHGSGWDSSKLDAGGSPGQGLHDQIKGCVNSISDWNYTLDPGDGWDFEATGHTTIWQKSCIENAMVAAGSPSKSCDGSG